MHLRWFICCTLLFYSIQVFSGSKVEILEPTFTGSGCPKGSTDVSISSDARKIDITFDSFFVEADVAMGHVTAAKNCETVIRVKVPHGFSLAVERINYNGVNNLPYGANAHIVGDHFFNHEQLALINKRFYGTSNSPFNITTRILYHGLFWTPCGEEAIISSKTNLAISASKSLRSASIQVDNRESRPGISYDLLWRSCSEQHRR